MGTVATRKQYLERSFRPTLKEKCYFLMSQQVSKKEKEKKS